MVSCRRGRAAAAVDHIEVAVRAGYFCLLPDMYYRTGTPRFDFVRRAEGMRPTMRLFALD